MNKEKVIFFGNGPLAEYALAVMERECQVIFHARKREDLEEACRLKREFPEAHGVLASFGVLIPGPVLEVGADEFSVSVMKLAPKMDAGPIYYQTTLSGLPLCKKEIYKALAEAGAEWICEHLDDLSEPVSQDDAKATFCGKLDKSMSFLTPEKDTADVTLRKIVAFQDYPKPKYAFYGQNCIILDAHALKTGEEAFLTIPCADGALVAVDRLQPEGRKAMDARAFLNGYKK